MSQILQTFHNLPTMLLSWIDRISKPGLIYSSTIGYEVAYIRNRFLIVFELLLFVMFFVDSSLNNHGMESVVIRFSMCTIITVLFTASCRSHPEIFNICCTLLCLIYGPSRMSAFGEGIHKAWLSVLVLPSFTYVFTQSLRHFVFQVFAQMIYTNFVYKGVMEQTLLSTTPEKFIQAGTNAMNLSMILNCLFALLTHYFMKKASQQVAIVEKKKDEIENQKTFLLGFSHELRNLLNSLTGNVKLVGLEHLNSRAKELVANAEVCGELLLHLVNNILDTGKVEIGELEINPVPTRIYDALERIWGVSSELIKRKSLTGKMNIPKNLPSVLKIDHYRLTQIFLNLVGNAVKFTDKGSITINVDWLSKDSDQSFFYPYPYNYYDDYDEGLFEKQNILNDFDKNRLRLDIKKRKINASQSRHTSDACHGILKVSISDTGSGMSPDQIKKLFQKFTQVSTDSSKRKLGTGLGLFITKQLCEKMNGQVRAYSQKDIGSSFIFCIPTEAIPERNEQLRDSDSIKQFLISKKLKAMIVDDTAFNQVILKSFFEKLGVEVIDVAVNGLEAIEKYKKLIEKGNPPHIVTMDLDMPIMDGKEASKKIRQFESERGLRPCFLPIVSGNCAESEISECLNSQGQIKADVFLKKPATLEEILRATGSHFSHFIRS